MLGTFRGRAVAAEVGLSRGGHKQVQILFEVKQPNGGVTRSPWWGYFNTRDNAERALKVMIACGWHPSDRGNLSSLRRNEVELVFREKEKQGGGVVHALSFVQPIRQEVYEQGELAPEAADEMFGKLEAFALEKGLASPASPSPDDEPPYDPETGEVADEGIPF